MVIPRKGRQISTLLSGVIDCTSKLSLNPDVILALSPPGSIAVPSFHPCVRLSRWAKSPGTVSFVPPDGTFTLLDYETPDVNNIDIPLRVEAKLEDTAEFEIRLTPGGKKLEDLTSHNSIKLNNHRDNEYKTIKRGFQYYVKFIDMDYSK